MSGTPMGAPKYEVSLGKTLLDNWVEEVSD